MLIQLHLGQLHGMVFAYAEKKESIILVDFSVDHSLTNVVFLVNFCFTVYGRSLLHTTVKPVLSSLSRPIIA